MKKIAFFDLNVVGIGRYPLKIAKEIEKENNNIKFYFLYEEDPDNKIDEIKKLLPKKSEMIKIKKVNYNYIKKLLNDINPESLLVMAQRIPDNAIVSIANELGIKTFKFQHGLYIPFMKRNISLFINKILKTIRYIQYALVVAKSTNSNKFRTVIDYMKVFLRGEKIINTSLPIDKINASKVFVYGEYWKEYHAKEYGYSYEQQIVVGYPDLEQLDEIKKQHREDAVCYICQTLVEDGRLSREEMEKFIDTLKNSIGNKKLYIKLHPRSDITLYETLKNTSNIEFVRNGFPHCSKYIGHYSSLLAMALYLTDEVFLWKFENHNEYPFYFVENANFISNKKVDLISFMKNKIKNNRENDIKRYFNNDETYQIIGSYL